MTWKSSGSVGILDHISHPSSTVSLLSAYFRVADGLNNILVIFADSPALSPLHLVTSEAAASLQRSSRHVLNLESWSGRRRRRRGGGGEEDEDYEDNEDDDGV